MVFQPSTLYPHKTVYDNMAFGLEQLKMKLAAIEARVMQAARKLQILKHRS